MAKRKSAKKGKVVDEEMEEEQETHEDSEDDSDDNDSDGDSGIYRVTEVIGTSTKSWEDASKNAIEAASKTLRDLRIAEVSKLDIKVENGKVVAYRARIMLSFKYQG